MSKKFQHIQMVLLFSLAAVIAFASWNQYQKLKLNHRYERLIEHREELNRQSEKINQQLAVLQNRFQDYLNHLEHTAP